MNTPRSWGRDIDVETVAGNPCRVYRHRPRSIAALFSDAQRWHGRTFVVAGERRLQYEAFERAVARVASGLRERGVVPGARVVLLAFNSVEWLAAFWAIQALGGVAVLCNAWWSAAESSAALANVQPTLLISDRSIDHAGPVLSIATVRAWVDDPRDVALPALPEVSEDALAIIMFTSGTTGRAKGVLMSQRGVVANIQNLLALTGRLPDELAPDSPGTVSLLSVPLFHLAGIQISISTLLSGGRLVLLEGRFDPAEVLRLIERERVRVWGSIPTMVSRVLEHAEIGQFDCSSLRSIPMGGAAIAPELRAKVQRAFPNVRKSAGSLYGCTEAGGVLAAGSADDLDGRPGCVGRALPVVELRIANPDGAGVGEILARTPTATLGVWGDPAPLADAEGWIRTGDLGWLQDGYLYLAGRSKDIVIRGGENISCAHVEECLLAHPAVREVAVLALPHPDLGEEVAAVVVLRESIDVSTSDLMRHAAAQLGKFEVPSRWWLRREQLPTNATGKIQKAQLREEWAGE